MSSAIIIIDNHLELQIIEQQHPDLRGAPLILLSGKFSPQQLEEYAGRGYSYFDELITEEDARSLADDIHYLLWNWFLDEEGNDLSLIDGCSLGSAFASSLEVLFNTLLRYIAGLGKLLQKDHAVYYSPLTEDVFLDVIAYLQREIGFIIGTAETSKNVDVVTYGKYKLKVGGKKRDLTVAFKQRNWQQKIASYVLRRFQRKSRSNKRVLLMSTVKLDAYFSDMIKNGLPDGFSWMLPISKKLYPLIKRKNAPFLYDISANGPEQCIDIDKAIEQLQSNLQRVTIIDTELLIKVMNRHTFIYFLGAWNYYCNALKTFHDLKPDLAIFPADSYENFILAAQAAMQARVKTAFFPHGICGTGYSEYKQGRFHVFDYSIAFSKKQVADYIEQGVENTNIVKIPHPYFERFMPLKPVSHIKYHQALILCPDFMSNYTCEKINAELLFYKNVVQLLDDLGIEVIGIKARHDTQFRTKNLETDEIILNGRKLPLLSGYSTFPDAVKNADIVIGPVSTALIEAGLLGKDYYVYQHTPFHKFSTTFLSALYGYVNASYDMAHLRENILKKKPYKPGCSVLDLVDLEGVQSREELFRKFEAGIVSVLGLAD